MKNVYGKLVVALEKQYNLGIKNTELDIIVKKITAAKIKLKDQIEWVELIKSMVQDVRNNPLKKEAVAAIKEAVAVAKMQQSDICPICGNFCEPISLMGDRGANYCKTHLVVLPKEF